MKPTRYERDAIGLGGRESRALCVAPLCLDGGEDAILCSIRGRRPLGAESPPLPSLRDTRVRAVVALSPLAVQFPADSLASVRVPTLIFAAEKDRFLVPRYHAQWAASHISGAELRIVPNAWHFAFMDMPTTPVQTEDGDLGADPPGFDRSTFLAGLGLEPCDFFDRALR